MRKNFYLLRALFVSVILFAMSGMLTAQDYGFKCEFTGTEVDQFPEGEKRLTYVVEDGLFKATLTDAKPNFSSKASIDLNVEAATYKYLNIRLKNQTAGTILKFLWQRGGDANYRNRSLEFPIGASSDQFVNYSFEITHENFTDKIKMIRIDFPFNTDVVEGTFEIDYIGLADTGIPTAIETVDDEAGLSVYPVPATNILNVDCGDIIEKAQILDLTGSVLADIPGGSNSMQIDLLDVPTGIYFLNVIDENNQSTTTKFVKQ